MEVLLYIVVAILALVFSTRFWPKSWIDWTSRKLKKVENYLEQKQRERGEVEEHLIRKIVNEELDKRGVKSE